MISNSSARCSASSRFESSPPRIRVPGASITAAATTGPASGPRPASSTPARRDTPRRHAACSKRYGAPAPTSRGSAAVLARGRHRADALLLEARRLAHQIAEVVELRPPHRRPLHHLDLVDPRRVHRERALHPDPVGDAPHRERGAGAAAALADHDALEGLQALLLALDDLDHHLDGVPGLEAAPVLLEVARLDDSDRFHDLMLLAR